MRTPAYYMYGVPGTGPDERIRVSEAWADSDAHAIQISRAMGASTVLKIHGLTGGKSDIIWVRSSGEHGQTTA